MAEEIHNNKARIAMFFILATILAGADSIFLCKGRLRGKHADRVSGYALDGRPLSMWVVISQSGTTVKTGL